MEIIRIKLPGHSSAREIYDDLREPSDNYDTYANVYRYELNPPPCKDLTEEEIKKIHKQLDDELNSKEVREQLAKALDYVQNGPIFLEHHPHNPNERPSYTDRLAQMATVTRSYQGRPFHYSSETKELNLLQYQFSCRSLHN